MGECEPGRQRWRPGWLTTSGPCVNGSRFPLFNAPRTRPESGIWSLESGIWSLESGIWNPESGVWNPSSVAAQAALGLTRMSDFDAIADDFDRFRALPAGVPAAIRAAMWEALGIPQDGRVLDLG